MKLLLVEDDAKIAGAVRRGLEAEGYTVEVAANGVDALWMASESAYDLIVLDLLLPGLNGFQVCADLRGRADWTPILVLTAKSGELDEAEALDTGADDFLTKPFSFPVLLSRIRALTRRASTHGDPAPTSVGDLRIDPARHRAWRADQELALTAREHALLTFLVRRSDQVLSKADIVDAVWEHDFDGDHNIVEVFVRRLRRKIDEPFGRHSIETVRGAGYRVVDDAS
jgi:DNA-binding response OmpR family regulator